MECHAIRDPSGANSNSVMARFDRNHPEADRLVREALEFCPDIWEEGDGFGSAKVVGDAMRSNGRLSCVWRREPAAGSPN